MQAFDEEAWLTSAVQTIAALLPGEDFSLAGEVQTRRRHARRTRFTRPMPAWREAALTLTLKDGEDDVQFDNRLVWEPGDDSCLSAEQLGAAMAGMLVSAVLAEEQAVVDG